MDLKTLTEQELIKLYGECVREIRVGIQLRNIISSDQTEIIGID